jgi:cell division protein FtsA
MARKTKTSPQSAPPLVAIDLGSSGIRAMAAQRIGPDTLQILGVEKNTKHSCVDRGMVVQTTDAGFMIGEVMRLLSNRIGTENLQQAFVLLGGRSMKTVEVSTKRELPRRHEITGKLLEEMKEECRHNIEQRNPKVAVLDLIPTSYVLDGTEQDEPPMPPQRASIIKIYYTVFVGPRELYYKVQDSFDRSGKAQEQCFVRPDALLSAISAESSDILTDGCAVIDFGAQTTTLSVYKGNQYLLTQVVAQGGWHITRQIEQMGMDINYAEVMKCRYGYALPDLVPKNLTMNVPSTLPEGGKLKVTTKELAESIRMKLDEITDPLMSSLRPFEERIRTLYITGGASKLHGMTEYIQQQTSLDVMYGSHASLLAPGTPDEYYSPEYTALIGALILGSDYREQHSGEPARNIWTTIKNKFENQTMILFTDQK